MIVRAHERDSQWAGYLALFTSFSLLHPSLVLELDEVGFHLFLSRFLIPMGNAALSKAGEKWLCECRKEISSAFGLWPWRLDVSGGRQVGAHFSWALLRKPYPEQSLMKKKRVAYSVDQEMNYRLLPNRSDQVFYEIKRKVCSHPTSLTWSFHAISSMD